jgi:hypothetical protein
MAILAKKQQRNPAEVSGFLPGALVYYLSDEA